MNRCNGRRFLDFANQRHPSVRQLHGLMERLHVDLVRLPGAEHLTIAEHSQIYERIAACDVDGAAQAMTGHITRVNAQYCQFEVADQLVGAARI